jgi:hypothetical protein
MKKLLLILATATMIAGMAQAEITFQKTYEVPDMKADEIKTAFGSLTMTQADSKIEQINFAVGLITGESLKTKKKQEYPVKCKWLGTTFYFNGDVILQARDGKYRITFSNLIDADTGKPIQKMAKSVEPKCAKQIEKWADIKYEQVKELAF